jgi:hypothetical protein
VSQVILKDVDNVLSFFLAKFCLEINASPEVKEGRQLVRLHVVPGCNGVNGVHF